MGCEIHAEQWVAIMLTTGRGNKRGGLHWNLPQNLGGRGGKLTRPTIRMPEKRGF